MTPLVSELKNKHQSNVSNPDTLNCQSVVFYFVMSFLAEVLTFKIGLSLRELIRTCTESLLML